MLSFEKPKLVCVDRQDGTQARETEPVYQGRNRIKEFYKRYASGEALSGERVCVAVGGVCLP